MSTRTVPFADLGAMANDVWSELARPLRAAVLGAEFIGGPAVESFEMEWARFCRVEHAVGVANGTDAIHLTLRALGIGPGDEVVVPSLTFVATAEAVVLAGATPRFADVDSDTLLLTAETLEAAITPRTKCVIAVDLYGQPANMDELIEVAHRHGLFLLEDAAQAHGARWRECPTGALGDAACFSFYPGKNLGAFGDAGAVVTDDAALAGRVRSLSNHGRPVGSHHRHEYVGTTSRLDAIQALVLRAKLPRLAHWTRARQQVAARYCLALAEIPELRLVAQHPLAEHAYHLFVIRVADRDRVRAELSRQGVETGIHYALPCHLQPAFAQYTDGPLPNAEAAAAEVLSLPMYPHITPTQVDRVIKATTTVLGERVGSSAVIA